MTPKSLREISRFARRWVTPALVCLSVPTVGSAQGVVVDQGQFTLHVRGQPAGTEDFVIRRAGVGRDNAIFANGTSLRQLPEGTQELKPLLRAVPPGTAESYQVSVTGPQAVEIRLARSGRRYMATIRSDAGAEDREFQARPETRILEVGIAHHYYFLRDVREGGTVPVLEPRSRRQLALTPGPRVDEEIRLGPNVVSARRVEFTSNQDDHRIVWFDRQGRVLRVEVPSRGFVAERTDLVG